MIPMERAWDQTESDIKPPVDRKTGAKTLPSTTSLAGGKMCTKDNACLLGRKHSQTSAARYRASSRANCHVQKKDVKLLTVLVRIEVKIAR